MTKIGGATTRKGRGYAEPWTYFCRWGIGLSCPLVDLSGRVAIVTGGNNGIGYETAKALAVMGAHTIIACRSKERAEEVSS